MDQELLLSKVDELPRIEKVLHELLDMVNHEEFDFDELAIKLSMDQMLSTRVLRMANSAQFGGRREISSINEAIIRIGSNAVRTLVRSSVLSQVFSNLDTLSLKDYWANTFEVSMIASRLGSKTGLNRDEVFTTGTLHDIGELMIHANLPDKAKLIMKRVHAGEKPLKVQREILATDVPTLGSKLAHAWNFPPQMVEAIAYSHQPSKAEISPKLAHIIRFSIDVHKAWDSLPSAKEKKSFVMAHPSNKVLGFSPDIFETIDIIRGEGYELAYKLFG